jgi:hypothetical protein
MARDWSGELDKKAVPPKRSVVRFLLEGLEKLQAKSGIS